MSRTVSYDVFDAVVTRTFAHPRDLFVQLGEIAQRHLSPVSAIEFAKARWEAELATRRRTVNEEVQLTEIYQTLASVLGWNGETTRLIQQLELELEARHLRAVPLMAAELAEARAGAGKILFLSDMYLPSAVLTQWLSRLGLMGPADRVFVSGEMRGNKSSGRLYTAVRDATGGNFANWNHAGDHPFADVEQPTQLGIKATHLPRVHLTSREHAARGTRGEFALPWRSLLAGAMRLARLERNPPNERERILWEIGTGVAGPLFYGFVRWVLAEANRRGLRRLYFLARDGQIFWRIATAIKEAEGGDMDVRYLYASRLVFTGPAELESPAVLRELVAPAGHHHSMRQTFVHLGLDMKEVALPAEFTTLDPDANLSAAERTALAEWLLDPSRREVVLASIARRRARARSYLASEGFFDGTPAGIVDTGWLGTTQKNLERILGDSGAPQPLTGFYLALMPPRAPHAAGPMLGFANHFGPLPVLRDESHKVLVELMAQSDHGQVTDFQETGGRWTPVLRDPGPVDLAAIRFFQEAILAFNRRMLEVAPESPAPIDELARTVLAGYRDFHDKPVAEAVRVFGFMPHADQLFEQKHATLCAELPLISIGAALYDYHRRPPYWWMEGQATLGSRWLLRTFVRLKKWRWQLAGRPS